MSEIMKIIRTTERFMCPEDERRWEEAWRGKIPLETICLERSSATAAPGSGILLEDFGWKHTSRIRAKQSWQRRYFVLINPFIYYFEDDSLNRPCKGAIYLPRAEIEEAEMSGRVCIEITSSVERKPKSMTGGDGGEDDTFCLAFDSPKVNQTWFAVLRRLSKMTLLARQQSSMPQQQQPAAPPPTPMSGHRNMSMMQPSGSPTPNRYPPQYQPQPVDIPSLPREAPPAARERAATRLAAGPPVTAGLTSLPISNEELLKRIGRLAFERPASSMVQVLLDWIGAQKHDGLALWRLMEQVEEVERVPHGSPLPETQQPQAPPPTMQQQQQQETPGLINRDYSGIPWQQSSYGFSPGAVEAAEWKATNESLERRADEQYRFLQQAAAGRAGGIPMAGPLASPGAATSTRSPAPSAPAGVAGGPDDADFLARMERIKARKNMVDRMLNDLPSP